MIEQVVQTIVTSHSYEGKILTKVILDRLRPTLEAFLPESQVDSEPTEVLT